MSNNKDLIVHSWDLRQDILDIVMAGGGGHIGGDMSLLNPLLVLYKKHLRVSPETADDPNRDRFVLSKGHSMEAYYAVLCDCSFLDLADVKARFSKFGSPYIGHPHNVLPGIEMNSGSLGHGLPVAIGMALSGKMDNRDYRVYTVMGTASWRRAPSERELWRPPTSASTTSAPSSTATACKFPAPPRT